MRIFKKLNAKGHTHTLIPLIVIILIGAIGTYLLAHSRAASNTPTVSVVFIKTRGTPSGNVEIHELTAASGYQSADIANATRFSSSLASVGTFQLVGHDLYLIQTSGTGSGKVEIHSATAASGYKSGIDVATALSASAGNAGTFQLVGHDLYFIQTNGTGSGTVEIHALSGSSNYQSFSLHTTTAFAIGNGSAGTWHILPNRNLAFVKTVGTANGKVELHVLTASSNYKTFSLHTSSVFSTGDAANGYFSATDANNDGQPDISLVKVRNTGSNNANVFYAEDNSYGTLGYAKALPVSVNEASNYGVWQVVDPGSTSSSSGGSSATSSSVGGYYKPLHSAYIVGRIDEGVDYAINGNVYAIGNGVVLHTYDSGWPGGVFIVYKLTNGPAAGKYVYVAEDCAPRVSINQSVNTNTILCVAHTGGNNIETGWAMLPPGPIGEAAAYSWYHSGVACARDGAVTNYGMNFNALMVKLGLNSTPGQAGCAVEAGGASVSGYPNW